MVQPLDADTSRRSVMGWDRVRAWNMCTVRRLALLKTQPSGILIPSTPLPHVSTSPCFASESIEQMSQKPVFEGVCIRPYTERANTHQDRI